MALVLHRPGRADGAVSGRGVFTEFLLARWAGFDRARPLKERRRHLMRAMALRDKLGLPLIAERVRRRARKPSRKLDPIARELARVERELEADPGVAAPAARMMQPARHDPGSRHRRRGPA